MSILEGATYLKCDLCDRAYGPYASSEEAEAAKNEAENEWVEVVRRGKKIDTCSQDCRMDNLHGFINSLLLEEHRGVGHVKIKFRPLSEVERRAPF